MKEGASVGRRLLIKFLSAQNVRSLRGAKIDPLELKCLGQRSCLSGFSMAFIHDIVQTARGLRTPHAVHASFSSSQAIIMCGLWGFWRQPAGCHGMLPGAALCFG